MSLRHALLGLLVDRTGSGYDLMKLFDSSLANVWPATQSQVYGELNRLNTEGLIEVVSEGARGRKEYGLTGPGEEELRRWLIGSEAKPQRSEALLKVFFLGVLPREQAVEHLLARAELAAGQRAALEKVDEVVDWGDDMFSANGRLALEYGLRLRAMEEEWARWAAKVVGKSGATNVGATDTTP
jgi:PadR family transcriptional regulator AphA